MHCKKVKKNTNYYYIEINGFFFKLLKRFQALVKKSPLKDLLLLFILIEYLDAIFVP